MVVVVVEERGGTKRVTQICVRPDRFQMRDMPARSHFGCDEALDLAYVGSQLDARTVCAWEGGGEEGEVVWNP
jgi:hypothetical protein